jgi:hypothetical protein
MVPFDLDLPARWRAARWKAKIRDKEGAEEPHVTILHGPDAWRVSLRTGEFLDGGSWNDIPVDVRAAVECNRKRLEAEWDSRYPWNRVGGRPNE